MAEPFKLHFIFTVYVWQWLASTQNWRSASSHLFYTCIHPLFS